MKLFSVLAAASAATAFAACEVKDEGCTTAECKYVAKEAAVPAVTKDSFRCAPADVTYTCTAGVTKQVPEQADQDKLIEKCKGGKGGIFETKKECEDLGTECKATQTGFKKAKKEEVPAKCIPKTCADYIADKKTCEDAKLGCVYTAKTDAVAPTYKCASQDGNDNAKKDLCEKASADNGGCEVDANGGKACCKAVVDNKGTPEVAATCALKTTTTTSNAAMAVTSAFAAAAAALLM